MAAEMAADVVIRPFRDEDERGWVICRVLSFLDSAFFDDVRQTKERYEQHGDRARRGARRRDRRAHRRRVRGASLEPCARSGPGLGGMIWHLAVHPGAPATGRRDRAAARGREARARARGLARFEAWTRDDAERVRWYETMGLRARVLVPPRVRRARRRPERSLPDHSGSPEAGEGLRALRRRRSRRDAKPLRARARRCALRAAGSSDGPGSGAR